MRTMRRNKVIYSYSPRNTPVEHVKPGERVWLETEDAFGGQVKCEQDSIAKLDWSKVNGATGPVFVEGAEPGDTLVVEILDIQSEDKGVIVTVPKYGVLGQRQVNPAVKVVSINRGYVRFNKSTRVRVNPMIGTIGVAPKTGSVPTGSPGRHGGNMDVKEMTADARLYLPVFTKGALFAAGDMHAVQADGELCVSSVEVVGKALLKFDLIHGCSPEWPILEKNGYYSILTCGETLDESASLAAETAVRALMREHGWPFEEAYMFGSLVVDLQISQVVDPKKGVRATVSKKHLSLDSLLR